MGMILGRVWLEEVQWRGALELVDYWKMEAMQCCVSCKKDGRTEEREAQTRCTVSSLLLKMWWQAGIAVSALDLRTQVNGLLCISGLNGTVEARQAEYFKLRRCKEASI